LLTRLGRGDEALDVAWVEYRKNPSKFSFDDLMKVVPKADRAAWREKALNAAKGADLHSVMELLVETKEMGRLAELVRDTTDVALENISHYATEPAAMKLEKPHPELAARLWRTQAMRIVDAGKSKYYEAAARTSSGRADATCAPGVSRNGRMPCTRYGPITTVRPPSWRCLSPSQPGPGVSRRLHFWNVPKTAGA
jgi:hypothetical protein